MGDSVVIRYNGEDSNASSNEMEAEYEVERIIAEEERGGVLKYLVKWKTYPDEECTWEPEDSFSQSITIQEWRKARERGDVLDPEQLREILSKMEDFDDKKQEAEGHHDRNKQGTQDASSDDEPDEHEVVEEDAAAPLGKQRGAFSTGWPQVAPETMRSVLSSLPKNPLRAREFHGITSEPQTARRTSTVHAARVNIESGSRIGQQFRNLRQMNNAQKRKRAEPAPNLDNIVLKPAFETIPGFSQDTAHILPPGPKHRPALSQANSRDSFVEGANGGFERAMIPESEVPPLKTGSLSEKASMKQSASLKGIRQVQEPRNHTPMARDAIRFVKHGRHLRPYRHGELIVSLKYGEQLVGDVKFVGLECLRGAFLRTKMGNELEVNLCQQEVGNVDVYEDFSVTRPSIGLIEPYPDVQGSLESLLRHMEEHGVAASWVHDDFPAILVAYPPRAQKFIGKNWPAAEAGSLRLVACSRLPWSAPRNSSVSSTFLRGRILPIEPADSACANMSPATAKAIQSVTFSALIEESPVPVTTDPRIRRQEPAEVSVQRRENISQATNLEMGNGQRKGSTSQNISRKALRGIADVREAHFSFGSRYNVTYEYLTQTPVTMNMKFDRRRARFFLAFALGEVSQNNESILKSWLCIHTMPHLIYSSSSDDYPWERFKDSIRSGEYIGVILVEDVTISNAFQLMPGFCKRLPRENLQIFSVAMDRALVDGTRSFTRIFPSGMVLLVTEGLMTYRPDATVSILKSFAERAKRKGSSYKLFLRPNAREYLRERAGHENMSEADRKHYVKILLVLQVLDKSESSQEFDGRSNLCGLDFKLSSDLPNSSVSPLSLKLYLKDEDQHRSNMADIITQRDERLLDFFAGWAYTQVSNYRRFVAVSTDPKPAQNHIHVMSTKEFLDAYPESSSTRLSPATPILRG